MASPKKTRRRSRKKKLLLSAGIFFLVLASLGATFYFVFLRTVPPPEITTAGKRPPSKEVFPPPLSSPVTDPFTTATNGKPAGLPQVAIVIDDMGMQRKTGEQLLVLDLDLTFSFLPYGPHTKELAHAAQRLDRDILLHLPMEPNDTNRWDPGPGALYLVMPAAALRLHLEKNLSLVPLAIGVNNHMGSKFTADREAMRTVLALLRPHNLFFLDSLTTSASVGYDVANAMGIPSRRRDIFLDNIQEQTAVERQLATLIRIAQQKGTAVAIGHPHPATVAALAAYEQRLHTAVQVVGVHRLME